MSKWREFYWLLVWHTPLCRIRWFRNSSTAVWCRLYSQEKIKKEGVMMDGDTIEAMADALEKIGIDNAAKGGLKMSKWRLPTIEELASLIDYSRYNPALPEGCPIKISASFYWSCTAYAFSTNCAWGVYFHNGGVPYDHKTSYGYVRCVRVARHGAFDYSDNRFEETGDGILDRKTGLVWQREDAPTETIMSWEEAMKYAEGLNE